MSINSITNLTSTPKAPDTPNLSSIQDKSVKLNVSPPLGFYGNIRIQNESFRISGVDTAYINVENLKEKILSIATDKEREAYFFQTFDARVERQADSFKVTLAYKKATSIEQSIVKFATPNASIWPLEINFVAAKYNEYQKYNNTPISFEKLNKELMTKDILGYNMLPYFRKNPDSNEYLFSLIQRSKNDSKLAIAASNAITILNAAGISLNKYDFSGVNISGADLSYANLSDVNFSNANLEKVSLYEAILDNAKIANSNTDGLNLDRDNYLKLPLGSRVFDVSPDGKWILFESIKYKGIWDLETDTELHRFVETSMENFAVSPDSKWALFVIEESFDRKIVIYDLQTGKRRAFNPRQKGDPKSSFFFIDIGFSPDGKLFFTCDQESIKIWNIQTGKELLCLKKPSAGYLTNTVFSSDSKSILARSYNTICIWDCDINKNRKLLDFGLGKIKLLPTNDDLENESVKDLVVSPCGRYALAVRESRIDYWNLTSGELISSLSLEARFSFMQVVGKIAAFSSDGKKAIVANVRTVIIFDLQSSKEIHRLEQKHAIHDMYLLPDGRHILLLTDKKLVHKWQLFDENNVFKPIQIRKPRAKFSAKNLNMEGVKGLSETNREILLQYGAETSPVVNASSPESQKPNNNATTAAKYIDWESDDKWQSFDEMNASKPILTQQPIPILKPKNFKVEKDLLVANNTNLKSQKPINNATYESKDVYIDPNKQTSPTQISQPTHTPVVSPTAATTFLNQEVTERLAQMFIDLDVNALKSAVGKEWHALLADEARGAIFADPKLTDYYYVFIAQWTETWLACSTIHSGKVANSQMKAIDYIPAFLDKSVEYLSIPGAALIKDILSGGIKFWSDREKQIGVNRMANYFGTILSAHEFIETLARELTLAQKTTIQALDAPKAGFFSKMARSVVDLGNKITANDIDTMIKERAADDGGKIIQAIMEGKLKPHPFLSEIPSILKDVLGVEATAPPVLSISSTVIQASQINVSIQQQSVITQSVTSPASEQKLREQIDQFAADAKTHKDEADRLRQKIESLENEKNQKSQPVSNLKLQQALKKIEKIESIFDSAQIVLPKPGQDITSLTKQVVAQDQQITLLTQKLFEMEELLGLKPPPKTENPAQKEKKEKDREDLFDKD